MVNAIFNMTPHPVNILDAEGKEIASFEPEGTIRLKAITEGVGKIAGIPISKTVFGEPEGLPEQDAGTYYIVSQIVKTALPERGDLLVPAEVERDDSGRIIGCRSLGI